MKYLLGIDFGGGASKATLLGSDGKDYEYFKEFLLECYQNKRKMRWS